MALWFSRLRVTTPTCTINSKHEWNGQVWLVKWLLLGYCFILSRLLNDTHSPVAVSYTHLDVYKRQREHSQLDISPRDITYFATKYNSFSSMRWNTHISHHYCYHLRYTTYLLWLSTLWPDILKIEFN